MPPLIGETLDHKYTLVRLLGAGGMGSVYEAREEGTGARVAVKVIHDRLLAPDSGGPSRFRREARAAAAVDSEHIVQVLDAGEDGEKGTPYIALEYLEGEDLQALIDRVGPLRPEAVIRIAGQALTGLQKAHEAGIVHRDVKPANVFLARGEDGAVTVKILDFGIAKILAAPGAAGVTTGVTQTGGFLGSPLYMSPEQVQNSRDVDARSDLWSLGSTLYCALAGRAPHQDADGVGKLIVAICVSPAPSIRERAPWVDPALASAVHATLTIDRDQRCPTAGAMLAAIRALAPDGFALRAEMLAAAPGPPPMSDGAPLLPVPLAPRRRAWAILAAGAALVLGVWAAAGATRPRAAPSARAAAPGTSGVAAVIAPAPAAGEGTRRVRVVVIPADAEVEIDGARAEVHDGLVEIEGALGSRHRVRVVKRSDEALAEVTVTEMGAQPLKVEIAQPVVEAAPPRPAGSITKLHPLASGAASGAAAASAPPAPSTTAPPPESKEDLLAPDRFR
jgi:serine/threonine-protein kinase